MNRYRNWVGVLHWGQLLLLVPSLLFVGVAVGGGAYLFTIDSSASNAVFMAETALREDSARVQENRPEEIFGQRSVSGAVMPQPPKNKAKEYEDLATLYKDALAESTDDAERDEMRQLYDKAVRKTFEAFFRRPLDTNLVRAVENAQAANERMKSVGTWVLGVGMFGWAFAWLTAFLSLWWWFGARAKPRENQ